MVSFGHLYRWLVHEPYRQLAEVPQGILHGFSKEAEPYSLCATDPKSLDLLDDLFSQLLPHFSSKEFNIGFDETFDLGKGRSADICAAEGTTNVYIKFLSQVNDLAKKYGRRTQFWGDIVLEKPEVIPKLPRCFHTIFLILL